MTRECRLLSHDQGIPFQITQKRNNATNQKKKMTQKKVKLLSLFFTILVRQIKSDTKKMNFFYFFLFWQMEEIKTKENLSGLPPTPPPQQIPYFPLINHYLNYKTPCWACFPLISHYQLHNLILILNGNIFL